MVLADEGVVCIGELDKMGRDDVNSLHETMEQQTVSIAKAGIVRTLPVRTSVLAAANPPSGRYDPTKLPNSVQANTNADEPLLTRFDLIWIVRDTPSRARDERITRHILEIHEGRNARVRGAVEPDLLTKCMTYVQRFRPKMGSAAKGAVTDYFLRMRDSRDTAITAPRQLEGIIRLAAARARLLMRTTVAMEDVDRAIYLIDQSRKSAKPSGSDGVGPAAAGVDAMQTFRDILLEHESENDGAPIPTDDLLTKMRDKRIFGDVEVFMQKRVDDATIYESEPDAKPNRWNLA